MIKIDRILVPTDFSRTSLAAIRYALSFARDHGAAVVLCHALPKEAVTGGIENVGYIGDFTGPRFQPVALDELLRNKRQDLQRFLEDMVERELLRELRIIPIVGVGEVVKEIVETARELKCDLIVMTSRERSWLGRLFSRSLTRQVVRLAPCPVLSIQPWAQVRTERGEQIPITQMQFAGAA